MLAHALLALALSGASASAPVPVPQITGIQPAVLDPTVTDTITISGSGFVPPGDPSHALALFVGFEGVPEVFLLPPSMVVPVDATTVVVQNIVVHPTFVGTASVFVWAVNYDPLDLANHAVSNPGGFVLNVPGALPKWHTVELDFDGPSTSETASPNPFADHRLDVTFTAPSGRELVVPGFYAADGAAQDTGASAGSVWRVRFAPDEEGTWSWSARFLVGTDVAVAADPTSVGTPTAFDGATGTLAVGPADPSAPGFPAKGRLEVVPGEHHLRFAETGERFLKNGAGSPENLLAYFEFDGTSDQGGEVHGLNGAPYFDGLHHFDPHVADWAPGDPTWMGGKGKGLVGALRYLASRGVNSIYFLTLGRPGDGEDVWPWTQPWASSFDPLDRYDVSKLAQWEVVFAQMERLGIALHVVLGEKENDFLLDMGHLGRQRKLYYREIAARFGHHLSIVWNVGEENQNPTSEQLAFAAHLDLVDPYDHPISIHGREGDTGLAALQPLLGSPSIDGVSLQATPVQVHDQTLSLVADSVGAGKPWFVSLGENIWGTPTDASNPSHDTDRKTWYRQVFAQGFGEDFYFIVSSGGKDDDLDCEDFRTRDALWQQIAHGVDFLQTYAPYWRMTNADADLVGNGYLLRDGDQDLAVYLESGTASLPLAAGTYTVRILNAKTGALTTTTLTTGGGPTPLPPPGFAGDAVYSLERN